MATQKTLAPTNQVITIDAFQDEKPDYRHMADAEGKLADAVNALNSKLTKCKIKTFTMNVATVASSNAGGYAGELQLTTSDIENAQIVIPTFGRKSGNNFPIVVAYENNTLRAWSPIAFTDVSIGVALFFYT